MKQWIDEFKLALVEENIPKLESLIDKLDMKAFVENLAKNSVQNPASNFSEANSNENSSENSVKNERVENLKENLNELFHQIKALLEEGIKLLEEKKKTSALEIQKFQKALKYLKT